MTTTNWPKYQSEYDRQKHHRERKRGEAIDPDKYVNGKYGGLVKRSVKTKGNNHPKQD